MPDISFQEVEIAELATKIIKLLGEEDLPIELKVAATAAASRTMEEAINMRNMQAATMAMMNNFFGH